jgi:isopropylmalate/homocitrate/citramalate synthase
MDVYEGWKMWKQELRILEEERRRALERIMALSSFEGLDTEKWEELKSLVYKPLPLNVDVIVDDTTLREGFQMASLLNPRPEEYLRIAMMLREIGMERLEIMMYTKIDREAIKLMKNEGLTPLLAGWCRANKADIDVALELDLQQVGISHPVSYIHFSKWPDLSLEDLVSRVADAVTYAREHGLRVFVHGEDSTRADWRFEKIFINAVAEAGAEVYRICDTIGCGVSDPRAPLPRGIPEKIRRIKAETKIPYVEIHAHDDLGNAVENTMAAIKAADGLYGKVYVSTTFLGLGDRAGNAETEKVIMNCYMHYDVRKWNLKPLRELAVYIASALGYHLPINKAIVGDGVFAHESGIHLHGISKLPLTYEPFPPELVGQRRSIVIGRRSGKHGIRLKLEEVLGRKVDEDDPRLMNLVEIITTEFSARERRYPMGEQEFRLFAKRAGFDV